VAHAGNRHARHVDESPAAADISPGGKDLADTGEITAAVPGTDTR
jgi:hypothetical protein